MKIFAVFANVELTKKPQWLDSFRAKYDQPYPYHITLKQPCNIEEDQVAAVKEKLQQYLEANQPTKIKLTLDKLFVDPSPSGLCIMIRTENEQIKKLQSEIATALEDYKDYFKPEYEQFENNFLPHITIARELDEAGLRQAQSELPTDFQCEGEVSELTLVVVKEKTAEQANDPNNQTIYKLK